MRSRVNNSQTTYYQSPGSRYGRTVDSHMCRIRNKIGDEASEHIKTVWGVGYKFLPTEPAS